MNQGGVLGAEGGREVRGQGVEARGELLHPLLQGQHLPLQILAAVVELRHELVHDALHLWWEGGRRLSARPQQKDKYLIFKQEQYLGLLFPMVGTQGSV